MSLRLPSLFSVSLSVLLLGCTSSPLSSAPNAAPVAQTPSATSPSANQSVNQSANQPAATQPQTSPLNQPAVNRPATNQPATNQPAGQMLPITAKAIIRGQTIQLEVARTMREQTMGLMYRPALPDDRGMLFPFNPPRPLQFWMKNTPQPLDMVFMLNGEVKAIAPDSPPCTSNPCPTYGTNEVVNQVIELRAGRAAELGLQVGDRVEIRYVNQPNQPNQ